MIAIINALLCVYIVIRAVTYQRHDSVYRLIPSVLAYVLIVSAFWQVLRYLSGQPVCLSIVIANAYVAYGLHNYRGNVAKLVGHRYIRHIYSGSRSHVHFSRGRK